ncbi:hypothetical protein PR202_gb13216 [Eleusine coracana subsp. coracana]|uniref:Uncharacterized protein n=1 Tax=Eleusine coracana subsp. coracana TaxID=191504 RepID=A0AAV5EPN9_ELECO|nr:hypothetical protein PR202_gb13216 [Eleusine coracana subsp. coracana]
MAAIAVIRLLPRPGPAILGPATASSTALLRPRRSRVVRLSVTCRAGGDGERGEAKEEEEESPESLFARELRRRGMAPGAGSPSAAGEKQAEEGGAEAGTKRRVAAAAEFERGAAAGGGADGQRERSMALNSEGLEVRDTISLSPTRFHSAFSR